MQGAAGPAPKRRGLARGPATQAALPDPSARSDQHLAAAPAPALAGPPGQAVAASAWQAHVGPGPGVGPREHASVTEPSLPLSRLQGPGQACAPPPTLPPWGSPTGHCAPQRRRPGVLTLPVPTKRLQGRSSGWAPCGGRPWGPTLRVWGPWDGGPGTGRDSGAQGHRLPGSLPRRTPS